MQIREYGDSICIFSNPVLIGLHLGFAIVGIDAFFWYLGEVVVDSIRRARLRIAAGIGLFGFIASWFFGGFYYVNYYGGLVKLVIKSGAAPWAHSVFMETKEHIFCF